MKLRCGTHPLMRWRNKKKSISHRIAQTFAMASGTCRNCQPYIIGSCRLEFLRMAQTSLISPKCDPFMDKCIC